MGIEDLKVLSFRRVMDLTGLPKSTIRDMVVAGTFPEPLEIPGSPRWSWREFVIFDWLNALEIKNRARRGMHSSTSPSSSIPTREGYPNVGERLPHNSG